MSEAVAKLTDGSMLVVEGKAAPSFEALGSDGARHTLGDYAGKMVLIYFYPKDDTPGCTKESCGFRDSYTELREQGVVVLGVSPDDRESHQAFIKKFSLPFVLLSDPEKEMMTTDGAWGEKNSYGKMTVGVIRSSVLIGTDGKVLKHWARVRDAEKHPAEVIKFLESGLSQRAAQ